MNGVMEWSRITLCGQKGKQRERDAHVEDGNAKEKEGRPGQGGKKTKVKERQ